MDARSREEEFQLEKASWARTSEILEEVKHLFKEKEEPSESEKARQAQEIYRALEMEEWSDEYDEEEYPLPQLRPHSPVNWRPRVMFVPPLLPSPPRARPRPPPPKSCFRKMKSLSLDDQVLEEKTSGQSSEINAEHGQKNNKRVVSQRKKKRAPNMEKRRRGKGEVS